jgi:quercetin dioxygenase-like cupin family protein
MQLRRKRFDRPDEVRTVEKARIDLVELGELAIGRAVFEPGWRWSTHVKPIVGTESCQVHHIGYVVSGHLHIEMTDGASMEVKGGDAFEIPPGHDAWVIGDEPWVSLTGPAAGSSRSHHGRSPIASSRLPSSPTCPDLPKR